MRKPLDHHEKARIHALNDAGANKCEIARQVGVSWPTVHAHVEKNDREGLEEEIAEAKRGLRDGLYL